MGLSEEYRVFVSYRWLKRVASGLVFFALVVAIVVLLFPAENERNSDFATEETTTAIVTAEHLLGGQISFKTKNTAFTEFTGKS